MLELNNSNATFGVIFKQCAYFNLHYIHCSLHLFKLVHLTLAAEKLALPLYLSSSLGRPYTNLEEAEAVLQKKTAVPRETMRSIRRRNNYVVMMVLETDKC